MNAGGVRLQKHEHVKYLGVSIDKDLSLTTQHAQCRAKLALMCTLLTPACMEIIISVLCCVLGMCYLELPVPASMLAGGCNGRV